MNGLFDRQKFEKIALTDEMISRYSRQMVIDDIGVDGQKKLLSASVFVAGTGGLGTAVATYLAAAGVGKIAISDYDKVELSNLNRQILYTPADVGRQKVEVASERLRRFNPDIEIVKVDQKIMGANVVDLIKDYDIVIDGSDNFYTRYVLSDACAILRKPYIYGSVLKFEGQVSTFLPPQGACYRCLYPEPPPPGTVPSCREAGVLGVVPGVTAMLQVAEAIKLILGVGEPLVDKLLVFDLMSASFEVFRIKKRRDCPACGSEPKIKTPQDIEQWCSAS